MDSDAYLMLDLFWETHVGASDYMSRVVCPACHHLDAWVSPAIINQDGDNDYKTLNCACCKYRTWKYLDKQVLEVRREVHRSVRQVVTHNEED